MVTLKRIAVLLILAVAVPQTSLGRSRLDNSGQLDGSLFAQSALQALNRDFQNPDVSFLLFDARTGQLLISRWDAPNTPIPLGSLMKPFAALAYGQQHAFHYPTKPCLGTKSGCWRPSGHGIVDLEAAITYSCNSYFRDLTAGLTAADVSATASHFGLEIPSQNISGPALAGLGPGWRVSPTHIAIAYLELARERDQPAVAQVLNGMANSGRYGTGAEVDRALRFSNAMVKTGTAACTHARRAPGDGFAVALVPEDHPRILLLVRVHGVPGAEAAKTAGLMLRRIEE